MSSPASFSELRDRLKKWPISIVVFQANSVEVQLGRLHDQKTDSPRLTKEVDFYGQLDLFNEAHPLHNADILVSFNSWNWWQECKQRADLPEESRLQGILKYLGSGSVNVAISLTDTHLSDLSEVAHLLMRSRRARLGISFTIDLSAPERGRDGKDLEWLWVKNVDLCLSCDLELRGEEAAEDSD